MFIPCSRKRMNSRQKSQEMWSCTTLGGDDGDTCSFLSCKEDIDAWESNCADRLHEFPLCQQSQGTPFNKFQRNHPIPAVQERTPAYSLICKDSCAVLSKQHLCSSWYVWKKRFCSCTLGNKNKHVKRFRLVKSTGANSVFLYTMLHFKPKQGHRQHLE